MQNLKNPKPLVRNLNITFEDLDDSGVLLANENDVNKKRNLAIRY